MHTSSFLLLVTLLVTVTSVTSRSFGLPSSVQRQDAADLRGLKRQVALRSDYSSPPLDVADVAVPPALLLRTGDGEEDEIYVPLPCKSRLCE